MRQYENKLTVPGRSYTETDYAKSSQMAEITNETRINSVKLLHHKLASELEPCCLSLQGDSTGNEEGEWFNLGILLLAKEYPNVRFSSRVWDTDKESYGYPIIINEDVADAYIILDGTTNTRLNTDDKDSLSITGDLEIAIKFNMSSAVSGGSQTLVSKFGADGARSYELAMTASGSLFFWTSPDGSSLVGGASSVLVSSEAVTFDGDNPLWVKGTLDVDNGNGGADAKYYTSSDGIAWTQLGTTRTNPAPITIFDGTAKLAIGARNVGLSDLATMKFYEAIVSDGIDGEIVASPDASMQNSIVTRTFSDVEGNSWISNGSIVTRVGNPCLTVVNSSASGKGVEYSTGTVIFNKQMNIEPDIALISYGHNGPDTDYQTLYKSLCTAISTAYPNTGIVCVTQNPKISPVDEYTIDIHTRKNTDILKVALYNNYGLVDAFSAFLKVDNISDYISVDGIHPTSDLGSPLWATEFYKLLRNI